MEPYYLRNISRAGTDYEQYTIPTDFKKRPGFNTSGKAIQVALNSYPVTQFPNIKVFQYDVSSLDRYLCRMLTPVRLQLEMVQRSGW
jgi:hypothetical protein